MQELEIGRPSEVRRNPVSSKSLSERTPSVVLSGEVSGALVDPNTHAIYLPSPRESSMSSSAGGAVSAPAFKLRVSNSKNAANSRVNKGSDIDSGPSSNRRGDDF